jgi:integrase
VKNARDHLVPLSPLALETVRHAIALTADTDEFLFPAPRNRTKPVDRYALPIAMQSFGKGPKGLASWQTDPPTPHDLRRTLNTRLAALGTPKEIRDRVLNHVGGQSDPEGRHYNFHAYEREKRDALCRWAAEIAAITRHPSRERGKK